MAKQTPRVWLAMFGLATAIVIGTPSKTQAGNAFKGQVYARQNCAECHSVEPTNEVEPFFEIPSFYAIAQMPGMSELAISVWLKSSHDKMPNFIVPQEDRENLAAYIMSLKSRAIR